MAWEGEKRAFPHQQLSKDLQRCLIRAHWSKGHSDLSGGLTSAATLFLLLLQHLYNLVHLDLSYNKLSSLEGVHTKLGNVKTLNLAGNFLERLMQGAVGSRKSSPT